MARRIINRKEKRAEYDAAERITKDSEETEETEEEVEEDEDEGEEGEEGDEEGGEEEDLGDGEEGDDEDRPAPKKKKAKVKAPAKPKRTRVAKVTRKKVVWVVFNNSNQRVAAFDYPKRKEADELAAKLTNDKKNTHFVQPVKEDIE